MGMLVDGMWQDSDLKTFQRNDKQVRFGSGFHEKVTQNHTTAYLPEAGRYLLYVNVTCPWSHRTTLTRQLKGLSNVIEIVFLEPVMGKESWWFGDSKKYRDPAIHATHLHELYSATDPNFTGRVSIPVLWDKKTKKIVNNDSAQIARMFNFEFNEIAENPKIDFYPLTSRDEIDHLNSLIADNLNDGVYRCLLARNQKLYEEAYDSIFETLDYLEERLTSKRYLVGQLPTEPDWRLFSFLIRFDIVYYSLYNCNMKRISDYPCLSSYTKDLYQISGVSETVDLDGIKRGYFLTVNPNGIVPKGPHLDLCSPHFREKL